MPQAILPIKILHYPQLDTILMVEKFIKENSGEFKKEVALGKPSQENDISNLLRYF